MAQPNFKNRTLFHGDNLSFLRSINTETIDLIAMDPPFNKGRDFHATPDSLAKGASFQDRWRWDEDVHPEWIDQMQDDWPGVWAIVRGARMSHSDGLAAFLCFMAARLVAMHRILKPAGSLYLHCDPTASHYLKALLDAIFGPKYFRNEVVWHYGLGGSSPKLWSKKHDCILFYSKGSSWYFDKPLEPATSEMLKGRMKGATDVWDIPSINNMAKERTGYPTQKPLPLYRRIVAASCPPGGVVLDPFCGCATTPIAAELEGRQWLGADLWDKTHQMVIDRLAAEVAVGEGRQGDLLARKVTVRTTPLVRTDGGDVAAPKLKILKRKLDKPTMSRAKMVDALIEQQGMVCQGCGFRFPHKGFIELDHNMPRADGGSNNIENRVLLCSPCNRTKSHVLTLSGLRRDNKKNGLMANQLAR